MIIGITGTNGAGKGTVVSYLVNKNNFVHFSVGNFLSEKLNRQKLEATRDNLIKIANTLRKKYGGNYLTKELYKKAKKSGQNSVIESLRTLAEINYLKNKKDFCLLAIDANPKIRYQRIRKRGSKKDKVSFDEFIRQEKEEMRSDDPTKQNLSKCIAQADFLINNDKNLSSLYQQIASICQKILTKDK